MEFQFEWDEDKAPENLRKHGVSFEEAETVFYDRLSVTVSDEEHSTYEVRYLQVGLSDQGRVLLVVHTLREDIIRIISARQATARERKHYEEGLA